MALRLAPGLAKEGADVKSPGAGDMGSSGTRRGLGSPLRRVRGGRGFARVVPPRLATAGRVAVVGLVCPVAARPYKEGADAEAPGVGDTGRVEPRRGFGAPLTGVGGGLPLAGVVVLPCGTGPSVRITRVLSP